MYITTKSFRGLRGLGQTAAGSKYGFTVQIYPGIPELQQFGPAEKQEAEAAKINASIKQQIMGELNRAQSNSWTNIVAEIQAILNELEALKSQVSNVQFKEAPQVPAHRKAADLVQQLISKAPPPAAAPVQAPVAQPVYTAPSAPTVTISPTPVVIDSGSVASDVSSNLLPTPSVDTSISYPTDTAPALDQKKILMYGGIAIAGVVFLALLLRRRPAAATAPAARRRRRRRFKK